MEHDFSAFVAARGTSLLRVAYLACGDAAEAEDLLQTALERTYRSWDRVRHDSPEPYVRRVIVNVDRYVEAERQIEGEMARRRIRA